MKPKINQYLLCIKAFCDGNKDCVKEGETGKIYNVDDYPDFIYADFSEHIGVALSKWEYENCVCPI